MVKLWKNGVYGCFLKVIDSFLFDRSVSLLLNGFIGPTRPCLDIGLPQGAVLSPLLFRFFVHDLDDIANRYPDNIGFFKFADDGSAEVTGDSLGECLFYMDLVLSYLDRWSNTWRMVINCDKNKTEVICFNVEKGVECPESFKLGTKSIALVHQSKVLGVTLDKDLNYQSHSEGVLKKLVYRWTKICQYCNRNWGMNMLVTRKIVQTVILSCLSYACNIWMSQRNMINIEKLWYKVCKSAVGAVFDVNKSVLEVIVGLAPIEVMKRVISIKHYLKSVGHSHSVEYNEVYMGFINKEVDRRNPFVLNQLKDVFRFLKWKLSQHANAFTVRDRYIVENRDYTCIPELSASSCLYSKALIKDFSMVLWQERLDSLANLYASDRPATACSEPIPIIRGTPRDTEVILLSMFYKNNLLNSFLNRYNATKFPSSRCMCQVSEQDAFHIVAECPLVDLELREGVLDRLVIGNDVDEEEDLVRDNITLLNCARDDIFVGRIIEIIKSNVVAFRRKIVLKS